VLRVNVEVHAPDGGLTLSVWNSGNPVPEGLDLSGTKATGLFLVQSIVVDHYGGEFRLEPYQGGTRAQVVLPRVAAGQEGDAGGEGSRGGRRTPAGGR
jgi:two-component sensor histidine kinase